LQLQKETLSNACSEEWRGNMKKAIGFFGKAVALLLIAVSLAITIIPRFLDHIYYQGPVSAHFDGARFNNPDGDDILRSPTGKSRGSFIARWLSGQNDRAVWPSSVAVTPSKPAVRVDGERMVATWVGHATVLIQTQGLNILTDPIFSNYAAPVNAFVKRVAPPGIRFEDLPKIDVILVSHNHYDHMDLPTIKRLWERDHPKIITSLGNDTVMGATGATVMAADWGGRFTIKPGIDVIITRNHHWGSRWGSDQRRALWSSFVVTLPGGNIFFAGDTGYGDGKWPVEAAAYGPVRFAMIPIGAFRFAPGQMEIGSHIGPIKAERVFAGLGAAFAMPVHWGTFQLSYEARDTPPKMLAEVMKCGGYADPSVFAGQGIGVPVLVPDYRKPDARPAPAPACLTAPAITDLR
jgi:L-ascorbate metabolism protein UlaG (beta-lactamase superfamily)